MAGKIIADTIEASGSQISLNVGNVTVLTASSTGLTLTPTSNVNINVTNSTLAFGAGNVSFPSITASGDTNTGLYFPAADTIGFVEGGAEAMRIDSSGNVGIGTSSPGYKLVTAKTSGDLITSMQGAVKTWNLRNQEDGTFGYFDDSTGYWRYMYDASNNHIWFNGANAERMRITSAGLLLINTTTTAYNEQVKITFPNTQAIHCNESTSSSSVNYIYFTKSPSLTNVGAIYYNGSVMAYQTTSDYRLKENIAPITSALAKIAALKPVTYTWKDNQRSGEGFIAHELQEHFPDAVSGTKDAVDEKGNPKYQGMDASILIATLTAAIQELKVIVDAQAVEIAALKAK